MLSMVAVATEAGHATRGAFGGVFGHGSAMSRSAGARFGGWSGELWDGAYLAERGVERVGPGPSGREPECGSSAAVHDPSGKRDESGAYGARDGELIVGVDVTEAGGPSDQVVGEDRAREPCCVRVELSRRDVFESGAFFEVANPLGGC